MCVPSTVCSTDVIVCELCCFVITLNMTCEVLEDFTYFSVSECRNFFVDFWIGLPKERGESLYSTIMWTELVYGTFKMTKIYTYVLWLFFIGREHCLHERKVEYISLWRCKVCRYSNMIFFCCCWFIRMENYLPWRMAPWSPSWSKITRMMTRSINSWIKCESFVS